MHLRRVDLALDDVEYRDVAAAVLGERAGERASEASRRIARRRIAPENCAELRGIPPKCAELRGGVARTFRVAHDTMMFFVCSSRRITSITDVLRTSVAASPASSE